uniref:LOW QUALITY PROTEIN: NACHT, LRR and PYD domains-containing protein 5 n=1 Tax=Jaculus jaculus TaxID=51337 RepID=UPI001E1B5BE5|nr:LOW QUALITY PROTEIN: NACHT, LRR and PYD domains-containing protein 5 [Jaculus jaculus]
MLTRLTGPEVDEGFLKIVQDWRLLLNCTSLSAGPTCSTLLKVYLLPANLSAQPCLRMEEDSSPSISNYRLQWYLKELNKEEFKKFKEILKEKYSSLTMYTIPRALVDSADVPHLASLLCEYYIGPFACAVAICIFEDMKMHMLSNKAREEIKSDPWNYKAHVITKFATHVNVRPGFESSEMQALVAAFSPDESGFQPHTVVLHGKPGIGKSALARNIMLGWAQGELYHGMFTYVFFLYAGNMKWMEKSNFAKLIAREWPNPQGPVAEIMSQPERLLFIVDGFDDVDSVLQDDDMRFCENWEEEHPVSVLMFSLLKKVLLPQCFLMITARDTGVERLKSMVVSPRYLLLGGIMMGNRIQRLLGHITSDHQRMQTLHSLMSNHQVFAQCQVPAVCSLVREALRLQEGLGSQGTPACLTLTSLYSTFMVHQLTPRDAFHTCLSREERATLMGLCRMSAEGVWNMRSTFHSDDLKAHGLKESELSALFQMNIFLPDSHGEQRYTFFHLSLQDFCAALYYVLEGMEKCSGYLLLMKNMRSITELKQAGFNAHLLGMKRFLFGLMNKHVIRALEVLLGCSVPLTVRQKLLDWVTLLGHQVNTTTPVDILESFYYLFETQDEEFVRSALNSFREVRLPVKQRMDLTVASFCLQHCRNLQKVRLDVKDIFSVDKLTEMYPFAPQWNKQKVLVSECWGNFCSVLGSHPKMEQLDLGNSVLNEWAMRILCCKLRHPDCKIKSLILNNADIAAGLQHLWITLVHNPNLRYLNLGGTRLRDKDFKLVCKALRHPNCFLRSLRLDFCELSNTCYLRIAKVICLSNRLKSLSLARNQMTEGGMRFLCNALKNLEKLILDGCDLKPFCCHMLSSALIHGSSLTHLSLSNNDLSTETLRQMCESLKFPGCILQRLILNQCNIMTEACDFLSPMLKKSTCLTHLSLTMNPLEDRGVMLLCEAIREPSCQLRDLELVSCQLTGECCKDLAHVITSSKHLKSLDLGGNALGDNGISALCEGLKQKDSSLRRLGLEACELTSECCEVLSLTLSCNRHLSSLNLVRNDFGTSGMMKLCSAFLHPTCNLWILGLWKQQYLAPVRKKLEEVQLLKPHMVISGDWYSFDEDDRYWWKT